MRSVSASPAGTRLKIRITLVSYGLLVLAAILTIPLRIPEILQVSAVRDFSLGRFFVWIAQAPDSSPLNPLLQLPFLLLGGHSRLGARCVSLLFAVAACYLFFRLGKRIPVERPYWALLLFMLLPLHFEVSFLGRHFEQALFLVVLATLLFFRLISRPGMQNALIYAACLTLCLYTDRYSFLPAVGYLLFLLRFVNRAQERRAIWYALAATVPPVLLFLPYAVWAHYRVNSDWLSGSPAFVAGAFYMRVLKSPAAENWAAYLLWILLAVGGLAGAWSSFRVTGGAITKRIRVFVLTGGVCVTLLIAVVLDAFLGERFTASELLWTAPAAIILVFAGLEWIAKRSELRVLMAGFAFLLIAVSAAADIQFLLAPYVGGPAEDMQAIAAAVPSQLSGDSCVVFVSQRFSKVLFTTFEPELQRRECIDFFHSRIVLASHPYVTAAQQQDAESFFRGLDMEQTRRFRVGGGQIVVMQQRHP